MSAPSNHPTVRLSALQARAPARRPSCSALLAHDSDPARPPPCSHSTAGERTRAGCWLSSDPHDGPGAYRLYCRFIPRLSALVRPPPEPPLNLAPRSSRAHPGPSCRQAYAYVRDQDASSRLARRLRHCSIALDTDTRRQRARDTYGKTSTICWGLKASRLADSLASPTWQHGGDEEAEGGREWRTRAGREVGGLGEKMEDGGRWGEDASHALPRVKVPECEVRALASILQSVSASG